MVEVKQELGLNNEKDAIMDAGYFNEKEVLGNKDKEGINIVVCDKKVAEESNAKRRKKSIKFRV